MPNGWRRLLVVGGAAAREGGAADGSLPAEAAGAGAGAAVVYEYAAPGASQSDLFESEAALAENSAAVNE